METRCGQDTFAVKILSPGLVEITFTFDKEANPRNKRAGIS